MARPKKQTVDYFPHYCSHGKTMFILEQKYGNDGYAFWFKLLEILGSTEGHYIRLENVPDWEFLQAKTHLDGDKCKEILDLLSQLGAIDEELWEQKIVWSDNFLKHIADVYKNRRVETPIKPSFYRQKPQLDLVSTEINPQSKLKESKLKETKENINVCFESLWKLYPNKKGKGQVSDADKRKLYDIGLGVLTKCIERYKESKEDWQKWQHGSTFFHSGYIDYLDGNYQPKPTVDKPSKYDDIYL